MSALSRVYVVPGVILGCLALVGLRNVLPTSPAFASRYAPDTAVPPTIIRHQMRLTDSGAGDAVNATGLTVTVRLYDGDSIVATELFTEDHVLDVTDGFLSFEVGSETPGGIPDSVFESQGELWLGIQISPDPDEMAPRMRVTSVPYALRAQVAQEALNFAPGAGIPSGTILMTGTVAAPSGFVMCDGSSLDPAAFPDLFAAIGTSYGGDGISGFNVPDLRQRFPLGVAAAGTGSFLGASGGQIDHSHAGAAHSHTMPVHSHSGANHTHSVASHTHAGPSHTHTVGSHSHAGPSHSHAGPSHTHAGPSHTHSVPAHRHGRGSLEIMASGQHTHFIPARQNGNTGNVFELLRSNGNQGQISNGGTDFDPTIGPITPPSHTHPNSSFSGQVGNTGGVSGDSNFNTASGGTGSTGSGGTGSTSTSGNGLTSSGGSGSTGASGTGVTSTGGGGATGSGGTELTGTGGPVATDTAVPGATGNQNPPFTTVNFMIKV